MAKVAVIAIGGNSLIKDDKHQTVPDQFKAIMDTCVHIVDLIQEGYEVVVTHGNGPQVGFILLRSEITHEVLKNKCVHGKDLNDCGMKKFMGIPALHTVPLDSCGADTQGAIGYQLQQALYNECLKRKMNKPAVTVVTQVLVDPKDSAFQKPNKPIGLFYSKEEAERKQKEDGWAIMEDAGRGYRRVVPSPIPLEIIEENAIKNLIKQGFVVIAVGGGGIPVIRNEDGSLTGTAAVIDKDHATSLLAARIKADVLIISTGVEKVCLNFNTPQQKSLDKITLAEAEKYMAEGHFKPGSMLPKIKAAISFLKNGGEKVIITDPDHIVKAVRGETGTTIVKE